MSRSEPNFHAYNVGRFDFYPHFALPLVRAGWSLVPAVALRELSALLPHETWISTLDLNGHALRIVGLTPDPTGLVRTLSSSKSFREVQLRSSMAAGQGKTANRFEMTMKLSGGAP